MKGNKAAIRVRKLIDRRRSTDRLILIGNNLVTLPHLSLQAILAVRFVRRWRTGTSFDHLILNARSNSFLPKWRPRQLPPYSPEKVAFPARLFWPHITGFLSLCFFFNKLVLPKRSTCLFPISPRTAAATLSREELRTVVILKQEAKWSPKTPRYVGWAFDLEKSNRWRQLMVTAQVILLPSISDDWKDIKTALVTCSKHTKGFLLVIAIVLMIAVGFCGMLEMALRLLSEDQFTKASLLRAVGEKFYFHPQNPLL